MSNPVLGISAYYHDSAAAIIDDGRIVAAAQEERFTRRRHDADFPRNAVRYCLEEAGLEIGELAAIGYYEDPSLKAKRVTATYLGAAPRGFESFRRTAPEWIGWKSRPHKRLHAELSQFGQAHPPIVSCRHHESHAASAFLPSPYESAVILCIDGVGEWATTSLWSGDGTRIIQLSEIRFPHSLGLLYSAFTYFCGFKVDSGEYKLMGLAPYGTPRYADLIRRELVDIRDDGSFRLRMRNFEYLRGHVMTGRRFERLFDGPRRLPESPLTERELDLAASIQQVTDEIVLALARHARRATGQSNLCLAGGVALNCVANGEIVKAGIFDEIWVQPAAGDAGGALGAALLLDAAEAHRTSGSTSRPHLGSDADGMAGALLGPDYTAGVASFLTQRGIPAERLDEAELCRSVATMLAEGRVVGWFQGRMEFGPRALGSRSILGDPRDTATQRDMNLKIKFRESFRPFAPSILEERSSDYFDLPQPSPYMLLVAQVTERERLHGGEELTGLQRLGAPRSTVPAVTHVDLSARIQTVSAAENPRYHKLISAFEEKTGVPLVVNTSFNVRGEPIVCTPEEAYTCFMRTDIDALAMGDYLLLKQDQPRWAEEQDWREVIPLD